MRDYNGYINLRKYSTCYIYTVYVIGITYILNVMYYVCNDSLTSHYLRRYSDIPCSKTQPPVLQDYATPSCSGLCICCIRPSIADVEASFAVAPLGCCEEPIWPKCVLMFSCFAEVSRDRKTSNEFYVQKSVFQPHCGTQAVEAGQAKSIVFLARWMWFFAHCRLGQFAAF